MDAVEIIRINLPALPHPRGNTAWAELSGSSDLFCRGKDSGVCLTTVLQNTAGEICSSQVALRVLRQNLHERGWKKSRKKQIRISKGICRGRAVQDDSIKDLKLTSSHKHTKFTTTYGSFPSKKDLKIGCNVLCNTG